LVPKPTPEPIQRPIAQQVPDTQFIDTRASDPAPVQHQPPVQHYAPVQHQPPVQHYAPAQHQPPVQHYPPAQHRAAPPNRQQPRRYGLIVALALVVLLVAGGATFIFIWLLPSGALSTTTDGSTNIPTPTPDTIPTLDATPTPAPPEEDLRLKQAQEAEKNEDYKDAIDLYDAYLAENAQAPDKKEIKSHVDALKTFHGLIASADFEMTRQDYAAAVSACNAALKMRPDSKKAQAKLKVAKSRLAESQ
jgi:hypothetical protein